MTHSVAIFVFSEVEVIDFAGPFEAFTTASRVASKLNPSAPAPFNVCAIADAPGTVRARAGLVITPDFTFADHPEIDLMFMPGGIVTAELQNPEVIAWIRRPAPGMGQRVQENIPA